MAYLTEGLEPKLCLGFFEEICMIPHGSGNEAELAEYIRGIATSKGYETEMDLHGNLLVRMPSSIGAENAPYFLMQGHMDMVLEKEDWCDIDLNTQPIKLKRDGNILYAEGTTLGADNAVGICNMLAVMTDGSIKHPPMELLFTVREEVGLEGIKLFDTDKLISRRMLTMDCGDPGVMMLGSAGTIKFKVRKSYDTTVFNGRTLTITLSGLHGGHTGLEAGSGYANALILMADLLSELEKECRIMLCELETGGGLGSIPNSAATRIVVPEVNYDRALEIVNKRSSEFISEYSIMEKSMVWQISDSSINSQVLTANETSKFIDFLLFSPNGALKRDLINQNQVLGSALLKGIKLSKGELKGEFAIRSNTDSFKYQVAKRFTRLSDRYSVVYEMYADEPAWPEKPEAELTKICKRVHEECFGYAPSLEVVHGGEEASIVAYKIPEMEIVGHAPYSRGAHTTKERLHLDSMPVFWKFLTALLEELSRM